MRSELCRKTEEKKNSEFSREKIEQKIAKEAKKQKIECRKEEYKTNGAIHRTPLN